MPGFGDILQKAVYLGVGLASYASEKAAVTLSELRNEAQKLADELVKRGEMNTEEARRFVEDMINQAQQPTMSQSPPGNQPTEPRRIEILDDEETGDGQGVDNLRKQVQNLQDELRQLQRD